MAEVAVRLFCLLGLRVCVQYSGIMYAACFFLGAVPSMLVCSGHRRRPPPPPPPPPELALDLLGPRDCWTPNSSPSSYFRTAICRTLPRTLHSSTASKPKPSEALNPKRSTLNQTAQTRAPQTSRNLPQKGFYRAHQPTRTEGRCLLVPLPAPASQM